MNKSSTDLELIEFPMVSPKNNLFVSDGPNGAKLYDYYLIGEIKSNALEYTEFMQALRQMSPMDLCVIHVNSPGGSVHSGEQVLSAMKDSEGYIIASIEGESSSMATQICLNSDEVVISDGSLFLVHNISAGAIGNMVSISDTTAYLNKLNEHLAKTYDTFLTEEEKDRVKHGRDVVLFAEDVRKRLETFEYPRRKLREEMKEDHHREEPLDLLEMVEGVVKNSVQDIGTLVNDSISKALNKYELPLKQKPVRTKKSKTQFNGTDGNGYQPIDTMTSEPVPPKAR